MKDKIVKLRISQMEKIGWDNRAYDAGMTLSDWIRTKCRVPDEQPDVKLGNPTTAPVGTPEQPDH